jgi:hypothetical protein
MILETPFFIASETLRASDSAWITGKENTGIYHCDNVSISALRMKARAIGETADIFVSVTLKNRKGHDKIVTADFEVLNGEELATAFRLGPVKVDEPDSKTLTVEVKIPRAKLVKDPITMTRITMTAVDG